MYQFLKDQLRPGEKVLWQGHPADVRLSDPVFRPRNLTVWLFAALFFAASVWYAGFHAPAAGVPALFAVGVAVFGLALGGCIAAVPFLSRRNLEQNVCYCITNERMIAYRHKNGRLRMQSREFLDFTEASVEYLRSGKANLYLGPKTLAARLELLNDLMPAREEDRMLPLTFTSILDVEGACACLPDYIRIDGAGSERPVATAA